MDIESINNNFKKHRIMKKAEEILQSLKDNRDKLDISIFKIDRGSTKHEYEIFNGEEAFMGQFYLHQTTNETTTSYDDNKSFTEVDVKFDITLKNGDYFDNTGDIVFQLHEIAHLPLFKLVQIYIHTILIDTMQEDESTYFMEEFA